MIQAKDFQRNLDLECLVPSANEEWDIPSPEINRPGMQFCGYYVFFPWDRPQIIGKGEMSYLVSKTPDEREEILQRYLSYDIPCIVICRGMTPPKELVNLAAARRIPVYQSQDMTTRFTARIIHYLNYNLAPQVSRHAVLLDVYGVGVLLEGKSGAGKSEAALELIKRGHQLVADDVVIIRKVSDSRLIGTCPPAISHLMEIRGIGIIDIQALYGVSAVSDSRSIDLILEMVPWDENRNYDRVGIDDQFTEILGVKVIRQLMPVQPGRNLAIVVEVAARNLSLKRLGYNPADELNRRLNEQMKAAQKQTHDDDD